MHPAKAASGLRVNSAFWGQGSVSLSFMVIFVGRPGNVSSEWKVRCEKILVAVGSGCSQLVFNLILDILATSIIRPVLISLIHQ